MFKWKKVEIKLKKKHETVRDKGEEEDEKKIVIQNFAWLILWWMYDGF